MRFARLLLPLVVAPLLAACVNDSAAYLIGNDKDHALTVVREQPWPWSRKLELYLVVARMPTCMRRHPLGTGTVNSKVDIWQVPSGAFIVKFGKRMYATETHTCEGFARLEEEPAEGMGKYLGAFAEKKGKFSFQPAETEGEPAPD